MPEDHIYRKKRGFHVPTGKIITDEFASALGERLIRHRGVRNWFVPEGITALAGAPQTSGRNRVLWSLMQFAIWYNLFIDQPGRIPGTWEDPLEWL